MFSPRLGKEKRPFIRKGPLSEFYPLGLQWPSKTIATKGNSRQSTLQWPPEKIATQSSMKIEAKSVFFTKITKGDKIYTEISQEFH